MQVGVQGSSDLLKLPAEVISAVLQQLDLCSLASTAASCSKLSYAVPANISSVVLKCQSLTRLESLNLWLGRHGTNLTSCSLSKHHSGPMYFFHTMRELPCPNLRQLHLGDFQVQVEPAGGYGVLHDCTGLTALHLDRCHVEDFSSAFAAIAALPELCSLNLERTVSDQDSLSPFAELQQLSKLTHLSIDMQDISLSTEQSRQLSQLSALVNLECLSLVNLHFSGVPGGLPSQLVNLTSLSLNFSEGCLCSELLQHLGSWTALHDLSILCISGSFMLGQDFEYGLATSKLASIEGLTRLTSLELLNSDLEISTTITRGWTNLTALESLSLGCCRVHPAALNPFTQLRALSLIAVSTPFGLPPTEYDELLRAVANLQQLTKFCYLDDGGKLRHASTSSCTALTASTGMCSLQLALMHRDPTDENGGMSPIELFKPGVIYPHLTHIDLEHEPGRYVMPDERDMHMALDERQLQQLCSSCPALEGLVCVVETDPSPAALTPMLQLSALTYLHIRHLHERGRYTPAQEAAAAAAAAGVVAQRRCS